MATAKKSSSTKKPNLMGILKQLQPIAENLGGFVIGNLAVNMANKAMKIDPADAAVSKLKRIAPAAIVAAGAGVGIIMVKQPTFKNILQGAAVAGTAKSLKVLMPASTFLGELGLTPVSAVSNTDRWLYQEENPISGMGFPDLGEVQPPDSGSGYYLDAPAYFQGATDGYQSQEADVNIGEIEIL